jgi:DNA replication protein DnaD
MICEAVREAALSGAKTPKYVISILDRCVREGILKKADFVKDIAKKRERGAKTKASGKSLSERELSTVMWFNIV